MNGHDYNPVTDAASEPVTLAEAKAHMRLTESADDAYIGVIIKAARQWLEKATWRAFLTQTWDALLPCFPSGREIVLLKGSLLSVVSVTYLDTAGATQTLQATDYTVYAKSRFGRILLKDDKSWPSTKDTPGAVAVRFTAGFGANASDVPAPLRQAVLLLVSQMYEHRTPEVTGTIVSRVQFAVDALIAPYRLRRF